jgi:hypothetical protein
VAELGLLPERGLVGRYVHRRRCFLATYSSGLVGSFLHSPTLSRHMSGGFGSELPGVMVVLRKLLACVVTLPSCYVLRILAIVGLGSGKLSHVLSSL